MEAREIYEWLEKQNYQTEYEETGEYKMYFEVDMPKILNDYEKYLKSKSLSEKSDCVHEKCEYQKLRCNVCMDCGEIIEVID
jgi:hypothetical protein